MNLLLDTCTALWWWQDSPRLSKSAREKIAASRNTIYFSSASALEISTKARLGKLGISGMISKDIGAAVAISGWKALPIGVPEAQRAGDLEWPHRDPFDRLLAAQAIHHHLNFITCDSAFTNLEGLSVVW
jgi:PIN domain nuclease of toxin-antitoxin system